MRIAQVKRNGDKRTHDANGYESACNRVQIIGRQFDFFFAGFRQEPLSRGHLKPSFMVAQQRTTGYSVSQRSSKRTSLMPSIFRFAPSPTGYIHIGNARTALWNALLAKKAGGTFILRYDDTDVERSKAEYAEAILEDLNWLGIPPDRIERQSDRFARYAAVLADFKARGLVYPCFETQEELDRKRKRQQARGLPPVYDRAALALSDAERSELIAQGRQPHWRFKLSGKTVRWHDGVRGECHIETASLSDPVMARAASSAEAAETGYLYTFASVIDDVDFGVTDILRGEDHVSNTAVQIELFAAISNHMPRFSHHNLIASATGEEMSKRTGALSIRSFRANKVDPLAVATVAVLTGTAEPVRVLGGLDELTALLDPHKFSRALTKFDPAEIYDLSKRLLHAKPFAVLRDDLAALGVSGPKAEAFWNAVHGNVERLEDAADWWAQLMEPQHFAREDQSLLDAAAQTLPPEPFDDASWSTWTKAISEKNRRQGQSAVHAPPPRVDRA